MPTKQFKMLLTILLGWAALSFSSGCAQITVPDVEICATGADGSGICKTTLSEQARVFPPEQWEDCAVPELPCEDKMLHISPEHAGKVFQTIEFVCEKYQNCVEGELIKYKIFLNEMIAEIGGLR